jgi:hypothetical protein
VKKPVILWKARQSNFSSVWESSVAVDKNYKERARILYKAKDIEEIVAKGIDQKTISMEFSSKI